MRCFTTELAEKIGLSKDRFPNTPQDVALAEEALAAELGKLSLDEHEKILFDVHGIATAEGEDPESQDMERIFEALEDELRKVPGDKSAYEHALYINEAYVKSKAFRLSILRGERFNVKAAAQTIIHHFHHKRNIFGSGEVLGREVCQSDLTDEDLACLKTGFAQVLPNRDGAGRAVVFLCPGYKGNGPIESLIRAHWYFFECVLRDETSQKHGIVMVIYNVGKYGSEEQWMFMKKMHVCQDGLPHKTVACHVCYNDIKTRSYITGMQLFLDPDARNRTRPHFFGCPKEIEFHLQTYGIPTQDFPVNSEETLRLEAHEEWLHAQRTLEETTILSAVNKDPTVDSTKEAASGGKDTIVVLPGRFDVLFGRGRKTREHTGNLRAAHLVEMYQTKYENANKFEKTEIAERIVAIIHESYGRFLREHEKGGWVEVDYDAAREKVSHFFRHLRTNTRKKAASVTDEGKNASNRRSSTCSIGSAETATTVASSDTDDSESFDELTTTRTAPSKTKMSTSQSQPNKRLASDTLVHPSPMLSSTGVYVC